MVPISNYLHDRQSQGVIHLDLTEKLPASVISRMIRVIDDLYFANLWLGLAETASRSHPFPDSYAMNEKETLYIKRLEIGTPNLIELMGVAFAVIPTFVKVAATLGAGAKLSVGVIKEFAETRKLQSETRKIDAETELMKIDLADKAAQLHAQGKITIEAARHKAAFEKESTMELRQLLPVYARAPQLRLIESDSSARPTSEIGAGAGSRWADAERRLRALVKPEDVRVVSDYLAARRRHMQRGDHASLASLQQSYKRLAAATGAAEKHLNSILDGLEKPDGPEGLEGRQGLKI